jgi:hypothetical protein
MKIRRAAQDPLSQQGGGLPRFLQIIVPQPLNGKVYSGFLKELIE